MQWTVSDVSFTYDGSYTPVFEHLTLSADTAWRTALIARNGRGKTTLLRLMCGELACQGRIDLPLSPVIFPFEGVDPSLPTLLVLQEAAPDAPEWRLRRELNLLAVDEDALWRPFETLSQGERTKALLAALFSREDAYPLIDEPTNHLDLRGRELTADYLRKKSGFLLVSHDRAFLNRCVDHVIALNRADVWVMQGSYDTWEARYQRQTETEEARNETLRKDIRRLTDSARRAAQWAVTSEKDKFHVPESVAAATDRGYAGAKAAAMMKRAQNTLQRRERAIEEKQTLLRNVERVGDLKLTVLSHPKETLLTVRDGRVSYGSRIVCEGIAFQVRQGERVALTGPNGCGKSSVFKTLIGESGALSGAVSLASGLVVSYVPQRTDDLHGSMEDFIHLSGVDETLFKAILRNMDFSRDLFDRPLERMSQGQKKKLLLARSLSTPAHLYLWDEPLNYIDVFSRVQTEELLLTYQPTLLIVEHDAAFIRRVCTREIALGEVSGADH